jgi:hypothetical protein
MGGARYPDATRLMITANAGGSNSYRSRAWKIELAKLAASVGVVVTVWYTLLGTSQWNKIEHRLFGFMSMNWPGKPLTIHRVIVELIVATTPRPGSESKSISAMVTTSSNRRSPTRNSPPCPSPATTGTPVR